MKSSTRSTRSSAAVALAKVATRLRSRYSREGGWRMTKDEKLHIGRCLERLRDLNPRQIFVVDCFSTDGTQAIVRNFAVAK